MKNYKENTKILGYSKSAISLWESGKRPVSSPLAEKLSILFPNKTWNQWKKATPKQLKKVFIKLKGAA